MIENWLPIPGYEGYEVSDIGRVRSLDRAIYSRRWVRQVKGCMLVQASNYRGLRAVNIRQSGRKRKVAVHVLVMLAFVGPRPSGYDTRHLNGNPADNRLANLAYGTKSENALDSVRHGTHYEARKTHCANGHPFSGSNVRFESRGSRTCRACDRANHRAHKARKRERDVNEIVGAATGLGRRNGSSDGRIGGESKDPAPACDRPGSGQT